MTSARALLTGAARRRAWMVKLLRELVAIPSESAGEGPVIERIRRELKSLGCFDRTWTDRFGNLFGQVGRGARIIAVDAHVDTVGVGERSAWSHDPYRGKLADGRVFGRGAGDQKGAVPAMLAAAGLLRRHELVPPGFAVVFAFTVSEEDCDGLNWQYIIREDGLVPECAVITDSTNCRVLRGQRGRMEIGVTVRGRSCHGSMPHKGDNAVYKIARVVREIERLHPRLRRDAFLGNGTITVSYVDCKTPSMCAVPDRAYIHLDRRLTAGETRALALRQVRDAVRRAGVTARVALCRYERPTYTGLSYPTDAYFPAWCAAEDDPQVSAAVEVDRLLFGGRRRRPGRWTFSTNGVSLAGMFNVPCVGFGPAPEDVAHTVRDSVPVEHLVKAAAFYALFPSVYAERAPPPPRRPSPRRRG